MEWLNNANYFIFWMPNGDTMVLPFSVAPSTMRQLERHRSGGVVVDSRDIQRIALRTAMAAAHSALPIKLDEYVEEFSMMRTEPKYQRHDWYRDIEYKGKRRLR